jgi:hypothetical protein
MIDPVDALSDQTIDQMIADLRAAANLEKRRNKLAKLFRAEDFVARTASCTIPAISTRSTANFFGSGPRTPNERSWPPTVSARPL